MSGSDTYITVISVDQISLYKKKIESLLDCFAVANLVGKSILGTPLGKCFCNFD